ncbi:acyl-CoA carboxylase epsilon subunit [Streptomyces sp. EMB26]
MGESDRGALAGQGEVALRIVRGQPGEEDIAALLAVLLALRAGGRAGRGRTGRPGSTGRLRTSPAGGGAPAPAGCCPAARADQQP